MSSPQGRDDWEQSSMNVDHVVRMPSEAEANIHSDQVVDEIKEVDELDLWLASISRKQENEATVDRVPRIQAAFSKIRETQKYSKYLDPQVVSLGPYHHGKEKLMPMERQKEMAAKRFADKCSLDLRKCYEEVAKVVPKAGESYAAEVVNAVGEQHFTRMMFLDGCFVADFIDATNDGSIVFEVGRRQFLLIVHDMFLVENQLPFVVVEALMKLRFPRRNPKQQILNFITKQATLTTNFRYHSLRLQRLLRRLGSLPRSLLLSSRLLWWSLVRFCYGQRNTRPPYDIDLGDGDFWPPVTGDDDGHPSLYLLDMLRRRLLGISTQMVRAEHMGIMYTPHQFGSVTELKEAGIRLGKSDSGHLTGVRFESSLFFPKILLPPMLINEATISQILNFLALELCFDSPSDTGVTSFLCLMDSLINHAADVQELRAKGILHHALGSDEDVARLFNELPLDIAGDLPEFRNVRCQVLRHRESKLRVSTARWLHTHFNDFWTALAFIAAIVLLFFTAVQTFYTVFPRN